MARLLSSMPHKRLLRFFALAAFLSLPMTTFAQDAAGGPVMTPIGWVLAAVLGVCFVILAALVATELVKGKRRES